MDIENKFVVEIDEKSVKDDGSISGLGAVFGNLDQGGDILLKGATAASIKEWQSRGKLPKMLWQHDPGQPIGIWSKMEEIDEGLYVEGKILTEVSRGKEALALLKAKAIDGLSIGYRTKDYEYEKGARVLKEIALYEVSLVTFPMNTEATASAKKLESVRDVERLLRDAGVPSQFAKLVASHGYVKAGEILERDGRDAGSSGTAALLQSINKLTEKLK